MIKELNVTRNVFLNIRHMDKRECLPFFKIKYNLQKNKNKQTKIKLTD